MPPSSRRTGNARLVAFDHRIACASLCCVCKSIWHATVSRYYYIVYYSISKRCFCEEFYVCASNQERALCHSCKWSTEPVGMSHEILNYSVNESISPHLSFILFIIRIGAPLSFEATASLAFSSYASCCWDVRHVSNNAHVRRGITPFQKCQHSGK